MAKIVELPKLSPTMEEGTLVRWAKNEGDSVQVDDLLAEVETDKATMEFRSFDKGTLLKRLIGEGATAKLGQPVAIFGEKGEDFSALLSQAGGGDEAEAPKKSETPEPEATKADGGEGEKAEGGEKAAKAKAESDEKPEKDAGEKKTPEGDEKEVPKKAEGDAKPAATKAPEAKKVAPPPDHGPAQNAVAPTRGVAGVVLAPYARPKAPLDAGGTGGASSPRVRRLAREKGVELARVKGSGEHGRITSSDVEQAASVAAQAPRPGSPGASTPRPGSEDTVKPASQMRKTIARRLTEAKRDVPHFYLEADLDVEALAALREQLNDGVEKNERVSVTDLLLRACALALRAVPASNASWVDNTIVEHHRCDISVAVAIEDGLVTPVVRDCDKKTVRAIGAELRELAERARAKKLKPEEMTGGVFSLSNLGMYGVDRFSAVINPPEGMILAVGSTREVPVVRDGAIVPGKRCAVTLSCDHRVVDGALGARFLQALRALVEKPVKILA